MKNPSLPLILLRATLLRRNVSGYFVLGLMAVWLPCLRVQVARPVTQQKVILDTDIGDDIDDAFALALALKSPELEILQVNADFGNTRLRARLLGRFLSAVHREDIPVAVGVQTAAPGDLTQRRYAERFPESETSKSDAIESTLELIRKYPGEITLIGIGPYVNIGAMIDKDPETFRKLKRVVIMGGSINVGYFNGSDADYLHPPAAQPEWNVDRDISGARKLFASGVPIFMMPLDATQLKLDEVKRELLFQHDSPITDQLVLLYYQWGKLTPTLYDPMAVGFAIDPELCPVTPIRIRVDDQGYTRQEPGEPNANVCLNSDPEKFFDFYIPRLLDNERH
jgi:purine nucleosidase